MSKKIRDIFFHNLGSKAIALMLALLAWALIIIKERAHEDRVVSIPVEVLSPPEAEVISIKPEEIRLTLSGSFRAFQDLKPEALRISIDLKGEQRRGKLIFYSEDYLDLPADIIAHSHHPKRIEVTVNPLESREIPVRVRFKNQLPAGRTLGGIRVSPEQVIMIGHKSVLNPIKEIETEEIDLSSILVSEIKRVSLINPSKELKFKDSDHVKVTLRVESSYLHITP